MIPGPYCRMIDREECGITLNCELNFVLLITTSMSKLYSNALIHLLSLSVHRLFTKLHEGLFTKLHEDMTISFLF